MSDQGKESIIQEMQKIATELLNSKEVVQVIGWEKGSFWYQSTPVLLNTPEEVEKLVWDDYCWPNLSKYLLDFKYLEGKTAIFVKGCDSRAFNRLLQDKQVKREQVVLIGLPCQGMKDHKLAPNLAEDAVPMAKICQSCRYPNPVVYDHLIGEPVTPWQKEQDFSDVLALEALSSDQRYAFWQKEHTKCIRCYACRNVCPACNCLKCIFDQSASGWSSKDINPSENQFYAMTRATHVAGRCIECGQCEAVCPADIPIMLMNKKLIKDINELFGPYDSGLETENPTPLGHFTLDDPEEFM